jgi:hypothetical protein
MAREFYAGQSKYIWYNGAVVTNVPFTLSCWFNVANNTDTHALVGMFYATTSGIMSLSANGAQAGDPVSLIAGNTGSWHAHSTTSFTPNTWHHAAGIANSATDRKVWLDGGGLGTNTVNVSFANFIRASIGRFYDSTPGAYATGKIAWAAIWDVALTEREIFMLSAGVIPLKIRRESLQAFWPMRGNGSREEELVNGYHGFLINNPRPARDPLIFESRQNTTPALLGSAGAIRIPRNPATFLGRHGTI